MPIYEYRCTKCRAQCEAVQKFSDPPLKKCERCGGSLKKIMSAPAIQFKGSGWYVTDYPKKTASDKDAKSKSYHKKTDAATPSSAETPATAKSASDDSSPSKK